MKQDYSWLEIAQMPQCCMCCGSRDINLKTNVCLSCFMIPPLNVQLVHHVY